MQRLVFTNGGGQTIDLTSGNFGITNWEGLSNTGLNIQTQQVPFQDGGVFLDALMEQREISVTVAIQDNNDLSARYERKRQLISALNPKLGEGVLVYTNDYLSRQIKAVPQLPIFENKNSNDAGTLKANVTFSCPSPYWEDLEDTVVGINLGEVCSINNAGDVPTQVEIGVFGDVSNPRIQNQTTSKKIEITDNLSQPVFINTNIGHKDAYKGELEINVKNAEKDFKKGIYAKQRGLYVAITTRGEVLKSTDGKDWEYCPYAVGNTQDIIYSEEKDIFIIVSGSSQQPTVTGKIYISSDLKNWENKTPSTINALYSITYSQDKDMYIAVGYRIIITSQDLESWNINQSIGSIVLKKVIYANYLGKFVAVGDKVLLSADATTWNQIEEVGNAVACSETIEKLVLVGNHGKISTSEDGETWTSQTSGVSYNLDAVEYFSIKNMFIIAGYGDDVLTSFDTEHWNIRYVADIITRGIICSTNIILLCSSKLYFSSNAENWENVTPKDAPYPYAVHTLFYSTEKDEWLLTSGYIYSSKNGTIWEKVSDEHIDYFVYAKGKGVYVGVYRDSSNLLIKTSQDLLNWETVAQYETSGSVWALKYIENTGKVIVTGYGFINGQEEGNIIISTDLINWTMSMIKDSNTSITGIAYNLYTNQYIATASVNYYFISEDLENWETHTLQNAQIIRGVIFIGSIAKAIIYGYNFLYVSSDMVNWELRVESQFDNVVYIENANIIIALGDYIYFSFNGNDWTECNTKVLGTYVAGDYSPRDKKYFFMGPYVFVEGVYVEQENIINKLSNDSDMSFNLVKGENKITLQSENEMFRANITYRQKYIGV